MKLGLKRKIVLVFIGMLIVVSALDTLLASYFTNRQNQEAAFAALKRDLLTWQDELQGMTVQLRTVALSAIGETVALNQLAELDALEYKLAGALSRDKEIKEAAKNLAFSKSVSLNRLHLVLRAGGFSAINVYINGRLSHQVSASEVGMFVQRGNDRRVWVKAAADDNGNLPIRNWPAWEEGQQPAAASLPPVERPQVAFAYPSADSMTIEVAVPVEGIIEEPLLESEANPTELSVFDARIAGSANDPAALTVNQPPVPFTTFAVVVFQKRLDQAFLQAIERKTGMWPLLFSPDGQHRQQLGPLSLSLAQLLPDGAPAASEVGSQSLSTGQGSFYAAALRWQFERQPGFVLALVASQDSTMHNIRQTVAAILMVTGLILAFCIGVGIFWVGRFIDPIIALTNAVKAIGLVSRLERGRQSDYRLTTENLRPLAMSAPGEIGELAWAFDAMIGELRSLFDTLEQRVQERTAELLTLHQVLEEQNLQLEYQSIELSASNSSLLEEIGERKLIEDLLRLREQEFRSLAENSPDNIARYDREGRITYWNSTLHATLGLTALITSRAHIGKTTSELYSDGRFDAYEAAVKSVIESGLETEYEAVGPDIGAGIRHHQVRMVAERDQHGEVIGVLAMGRDITERRRVEQTLKFIAQCNWKEGGESFLTALARYLGTILEVDYVLIDKLADVSGYAETVALYARGEVLPNMQYSLEHTPCRNVVEGGLCCYAADVQQQFPKDTLLVDMQVESYSGIPLWDSNGKVLGLVAVMDGKPIDDTATVTSILQLVATRAAAELEREQSERALAKSRQFLNQVIDAIPDPVFVKDRDHRWILLNREFCEFIGHPMDSLLGKSDYDFFPAHEADVFWMQDEAVFNSGREDVNEEAFTGRDGVTHTILTKKICYADDRGRQYLVGIILDITERKRMETELKSQADFQQTILNAVADAGMQLMMVEEGRITHVGNRKLAYEFGFTDADIGTHPTFTDIIHPDDLPRVMDYHVRRMAGEAVPSSYELGLITRNGERREYETSVAIVPGTSPVRMITVGKDITERKCMERALASREQELRALAESSPGMVGSFYSRPDGSICMPYVSPNIRELFGLHPEDVADDATSLLALNHPADAQRVMDSIAESARTMTTWHTEYRILHPTRGERWMEGNTNPFPHPDGGIVWYGYVHDITERKQVEAEKQRLINILEQSADFVGSADMQGNLLYHNRAALQMLGLPETTDFSTMRVADMHPAWAAKRLREIAIPAALIGGVWRGETALQHSDGREIPVSQLVIVHRDADGKPEYTSTIMQDITERKQAEDEIRALNASLEQRVLERTEELRRQTRYLRTVIDMLPMMAWLKDKDSRFLVVNQAFASACSLGVDDLVGKSDLDAWPREHAEAYLADDAEVMATGRRKTLETPFIDAQNGAIWLETFKAPVVDEDGCILGTVGVARDISERRAVEKARESALAEAERLAQLRSEFMARMSHELRTPLNGILGYTQVLQAENRLDERHNMMLNVIQKSGEHLLSLINDILDFAKIEAGKQELSFSDVHLPVFLGHIAGIVGVNSEQKQLAFVYEIAEDVPEGIRADEMRLRQVLLNLLSNAVKYTERGKISLKVTALEPGRLRFKVQDSGIGIEDGQLETIFRPFEQAGDSRNHTSGTGLGLVISRELVRLMGSEIFVTSQVGKGSCFWFDLDTPVVDVFRQIMPAQQLASGYRGPGRRRVLVVDDIDANRALLIDMLSRLGFDTLAASNGRECLESVGMHMPDLVLLDMVMPEMDGLEAARRLRCLPGFGQTPIIAVSASASGTDVAEALEAGVNAFLSKPIELKRLMVQIGGLLNLDWIYALPEVEASPQQRYDEWLEVPPMEEMKVLYRMALEGSMRDIIRQAAYFEELDSRYRPFAEQLRKLCQDYQSKAVLDLVERYINSSAADCR